MEHRAHKKACTNAAYTGEADKPTLLLSMKVYLLAGLDYGGGADTAARGTTGCDPMPALA